MTLEVTPATLRSAGTAWTEQGEELRGATTGLDGIEAGAVGPRASAALQAWATHWASRVRAMQTSSQAHGEALTEAADGSDAADQDAVGDLGSLRGLLAGGS